MKKPTQQVDSDLFLATEPCEILRAVSAVQQPKMLLQSFDVKPDAECLNIRVVLQMNLRYKNSSSSNIIYSISILKETYTHCLQSLIGGQQLLHLMFMPPTLFLELFEHNEIKKRIMKKDSNFNWSRLFQIIEVKKKYSINWPRLFQIIPN